MMESSTKEEILEICAMATTCFCKELGTVTVQKVYSPAVPKTSKLAGGGIEHYSKAPDFVRNIFSKKLLKLSFLSSHNLNVQYKANN